MILLTGVSGFIGSQLLDSLIESYGSDKVVALTSRPITKCRYLLHNGYNFDDDYFINEGFDSITSIIHAGAFTPKSGAEANDVINCNSNIKSTTRLLLSDFPKLKKFIFLSSIDVYSTDRNPISEGTHIAPCSLYGDSKVYCEKLISVWCDQKGVKFQILRIGHVYGVGEDRYKKIIPLTMSRLFHGETIQVYGSGNELRSFIYVSDVVKSIVKSLTITSDEGVINIVGNNEISIKDLIEKLVLVSKKNPIIEKVETLVKPRDLIFDNTKMKQLLFEPEVSLSSGLQREWNYMSKLMR